MAELKVTIKNIPEEIMHDVWKWCSEISLKKFNEVIEKNNDIKIDFGSCTNHAGVFEIISRSVSEHCAKTGMKIKGTA